MKYLIFNKAINEENAQELLDFISSTPGPVTISLGCGGGSSTAAAVVTYALNLEHERITLIAGPGIYSSAFELFYWFKGEKMLAFSCRGMYHYSTREITLNADRTAASEEDRCMSKNMKAEQLRELEFAGSFMTEKELMRMKKGRDVFFTFERMQEIFPKCQII